MDEWKKKCHLLFTRIRKKEKWVIETGAFKILLAMQLDKNSIIGINTVYSQKSNSTFGDGQEEKNRSFDEYKVIAFPPSFKLSHKGTISLKIYRSP